MAKNIQAITCIGFLTAECYKLGNAHLESNNFYN